MTKTSGYNIQHWQPVSARMEELSDWLLLSFFAYSFFFFFPKHRRLLIGADRRRFYVCLALYNQIIRKHGGKFEEGAY